MPQLVARLSLPEAVALSLSIISPTLTAAFNITLVVQAAGPAAPLTFMIGTVAMTLVALAFIGASRRVAHAGSAYAYILHSFGSRAGFTAGWTILLTYLGFATGCAALVGSFTAAVLLRLGLDLGRGWIAIAAASMLAAWWLAFRDMRLAARLMLALEGLAVLAILALCVSILVHVQPGIATTRACFVPSGEFGGWTGIGFGMVFTVLSFAGFEGAATLGEETVNPRGNIPIAMLGTVLGAGAFFVFVAYCEIVGFGPGGAHALGASTAPLNELALRFGSQGLATALDLATAISAFSGVMGGLAAAARVLFALGRAGLAPTLGSVHAVHGTPSRAVSLAAAMIIGPFVIFAPWSGAEDYYSDASTIGTLALILIYIGVGGAEMLEGWRTRRRAWAALCAAGPLVLLWTLYHTIYPRPEYPNNLWPYVALAWVLASLGVIRLRPAVALAPLPDYR